MHSSQEHDGHHTTTIDMLVQLRVTSAVSVIDLLKMHDLALDLTNKTTLDRGTHIHKELLVLNRSDQFVRSSDILFQIIISGT